MQDAVPEIVPPRPDGTKGRLEIASSEPQGNQKRGQRPPKITHSGGMCRRGLGQFCERIRVDEQNGRNGATKRMVEADGEI